MLHGGRTRWDSGGRRAEEIRRGTFRVLVATDIAARGIDVYRSCHQLRHANCPEDRPSDRTDGTDADYRSCHDIRHRGGSQPAARD
ncbi:MAG: helicase-related protein [Nitrospiraceae bacterium]